VKVPVRLVKREAAPPADAYLLFAENAEPLRDGLSHAGALPQVFPVRGGFLLIYSAPPAQEPRGAIRLRKLGGQLYLPADADLLPAFLPEEINDLTAKRGLVAMPGGSFLAFDPEAALLPGDWLAPPTVRRHSWHPIPPAPFQPDRLTRIEFQDDRPAAILEILNEGAPDDAEPLTGQGEAGGNDPIPEDVRPKGAGPIAKFGAGMALGGAKMLAWMGQQLGMPGLAKLGGSLARKAVERVPRITEKIMGAQEAALREILRQLQSGDAEKALRRAPIAVGDPNDPPARVSDTAQLGNVDPRYSLRSLLGSGGVGAAWLGGGDVWLQLAEQYRRLAREALARGDFRRAAYLYGVLLRDLRSAANALSSGGLHKDAAILYRDKLNDLPAAAQAFERAGNIEESLRLYEKMERYEDAAEMLRRLGDEERAEQYFIRAAREHAKKNHWLAAGDLVRTKVGRHDLAGEFYSSGWVFAGAEVVPCGQRLLDQSLATEEWNRAEELFTEAEERFASRTKEAGSFFNYALRLKEFLPEEKRDDWHDRVRSVFADQVNRSAKAANLAVEHFGDRKNWPPEVMRDAIHASRRRIPAEAAEPLQERTKKLLDGTVVAVAVARDSRDIVVASTTAVVCWRVKEQRLQQIPGGWIREEVIGLSVDDRAEHVFVLSRNGQKVTLQAFQNHVAGYFKEGGKVEFEIEETHRGEWYVSPCSRASDGGSIQVVLLSATRYFRFQGHFLKELGNSPRASSATTHLFIEAARPGEIDQDWWWEGETVHYGENNIPNIEERYWQPHWRPDSPRGNPILVSPMEAVAKQGTLEVAAVDAKGILCWSRFEANLEEEHPRSHQLFSHHMDRFAAACLLRENFVVAVTFKNEILCFKVYEGILLRCHTVPLNVPSQAVFLVSRPHAGEIAAILEDGSALLVPMP
jgi:tetratricopeptide (TPR) repeat protein